MVVQRNQGRNGHTKKPRKEWSYKETKEGMLYRETKEGRENERGGKEGSLAHYLIFKAQTTAYFITERGTFNKICLMCQLNPVPYT